MNRYASKSSSQNPLLSNKGRIKNDFFTSFKEQTDPITINKINIFPLKIEKEEEKIDIGRINTDQQAEKSMVKMIMADSSLHEQMSYEFKDKLASGFLKSGSSIRLPIAASQIQMKLQSGGFSKLIRTNSLVKYMKNKQMDKFLNIEQLNLSLKYRQYQRSSFILNQKRQMGINNKQSPVSKLGQQMELKSQIDQRVESNQWFTPIDSKLKETEKSQACINDNKTVYNQDMKFRMGSGINSPFKQDAPSDVFSSENLSQFQFNQKKSSNCISQIEIQRENFPKVSKKQKTLIFDFDETIAKVSQHKSNLPFYDEQLDLLTSTKTHTIFIALRPNLKKVLKQLKQHFELVLFSSSSRIYCEAVIKNVLENEEQFFDYKLFKSQCTGYFVGNRGTIIKNLDILLKGRELKDLIIIDNRSENYIQQISNGIPINDFNGDPQDDALQQLSDFLISKILPAKDVRQVIESEILGLESGQEYHREEQLHSQLQAIEEHSSLSNQINI